MSNADRDTKNDIIPQKPHKRHWTVDLLVWCLFNWWKVLAGGIAVYLLYRYLK